MTKQQKLELTWIGKENRPKLEPRILLEDSSKSYHAKQRVSENDLFDNRLIFGDNLLALKALEQEFAGKVKCIYIDPPYNTGQMFKEYDDGLEHSIWLGLMRERLIVLRRLLEVDGVLFMQLNDEEMAYGKILLDEVFGRANFINQVTIKTKNTAGASGGGEDKRLKKNVEYLLIYTRDYASFPMFNDVYDEVDLLELIEEMEADGKSWKYTSILQERGSLVETREVLDGSGQPIVVEKYRGIRRTTVNALERQGISRDEVYSSSFDAIFSDTNAQTSIRTRIIDEFTSLADDELLVARYVPRSGKDKGNIVEHYYVSPSIRRVIWLKDSAVKKRNRIIKLEKLGTYWSGFNWNNVNKEGGVEFSGGKKPETLVARVLDLASSPGDLVLDSFAGSGTTGAVAQKMGRRWIMVELGEHCHTHIIPRLKKVIDGEDKGGVTEAVGWNGGGGFRYYRLAPSLLEKDHWGHWVINRESSTERDFLYVTTASLTHEQLQQLSDEVGPDRTLLVLCTAFRAKADRYENLTVRKIPRQVLSRCEWAHDDYSLQVENLPKAPEPQAQQHAQAGLFEDKPA
jgi:adenine-specific DNA-methyltransferase